METNINLSSIDISNQDKLECPDCAEYCTMKNSLIKFNKNNPVEFESIICKKCSFEFCYILCVFCQKALPVYELHPRIFARIAHVVHIAVNLLT